MQWIVIGLLFALTFVVVLSMINGNGFTYKFEEKTVKAAYLEEARRKLSDYRSPLVETDDPSLI